MANMFMKLGDLEIKQGGSTAVFTGGDKVTQDNWFTIRSVNWRATRDINMKIGDIYNEDTGLAAMAPLTFTKEQCGASEVILSRMLVPGTKGDTVDIIITKPDTTGNGVAVYIHFQLTHARVIEADFNIAEGAKPFECFALAYSRILIKHWNEDEGGNLEPGGDVTYDLATGEALSHAITDGGSSAPDEL